MDVEKILQTLIEHKGKVDATLKGFGAELTHIRFEIGCLTKKITSRPSWAVCFILTGLCTIIGVLAVMLANKW